MMQPPSGVIFSQSPWRQTAGRRERVGVEVAGEVARVAGVVPEVQRHRRHRLGADQLADLADRPAWPCSFQASTAQPSWRHCIAPGGCGSSRLPPMKAPAKSVPPEMLHHQMSACAALALLFASAASALNHAAFGAAASRCCRARARARGRRTAPRSTPAFMQLAKKAAPAPKKVTLVSRGEAPQHAPVGLLLAAAGIAVVDAEVVPKSRPGELAVPHHPAGGAVPVEALAERLLARSCSRCRCAAQQRQRHDHRCRHARARSAWAGRWCRWNRRSTADGRRAATPARTRRSPCRRACENRRQQRVRRRAVAAVAVHEHVLARSAAPRAVPRPRRVRSCAGRRRARRRRRSAPSARSGGSGRAPRACPCRARRRSTPRRCWRTPGRRPWSRARWAGRPRRGRRG